MNGGSASDTVSSSYNTSMLCAVVHLLAPTMSSAQRLRESIRERLAAVSQEIYSAFEQTIARYKAELESQRRLLDIVWKPDIRLRRADLQVLDRREDNQQGLPEWQLENQEGTSGVEEEQRELPQANENQEEPGCSQERDRPPNHRPSDNVENRPCDSDTRKMCFKCDVCGKAFKLTFHLKRHLRRHTSVKPYP